MDILIAIYAMIMLALTFVMQNGLIVILGIQEVDVPLRQLPEIRQAIGCNILCVDLR